MLTITNASPASAPLLPRQLAPGTEGGQAARGLDDLPPELAFLADRGVPLGVLRAAAAQARACGVSGDEALLASGALDEESFHRALALTVGIPYLAEATPLDPAARWPESVLAGVAPLGPGPARFVVAPRPEIVRRLLARRGPPPRDVAIVAPGVLRRMVSDARGAEIARLAAHGLPDRRPEHSYRGGARPAQALALAAGGAGLALAALIEPVRAAALAGLLAAPLFLGMVVFRVAALLEPVGIAPHRPPPRRADASLPVYTILVALYREARVVGRLAEALLALDYPRAKLDIKLVIEADDGETAAALAALALPGCFEVIVCPDGAPRTKPRALNAALPLARGRYTVVYDAEDQPDPDQLRLAVAAFDRAGPDVACLQARLVVDNTGDSWLARMFTLEYAGLFDVLNPGLARADLPMPLGGTSNHFRTEVLRGVGAWDAWNVTEDADLGIRLARAGWRVGDLPSSTHEEAPARLAPWMRQRVRWMKGFMQTCVTHSRHPVRALRALGPVRFLAAVTLTAGTVLSALLFPVLTAASLLALSSGSLLQARTWPEIVASSLSLAVFACGLVAMVGPGMAGALRRGWGRFALQAVMLPAYYVLVSLAAWRALYEFAVHPTRWNKTEHGLARTSRARGLTAPTAGPSPPPRGSAAG